MFKVVEAFSGIGSQSKALKNIGLEHEIIATIDWDINAIIAYDIIHNGQPNLSMCNELSIEQIRDELKNYTLSSDGKIPLTKAQIEKLPVSVAKHLFVAIKRSKNLVSITDIKGSQLEKNIDLLTYSFPCQDLSIARAWHGENGGIDRNAKNKSGMLWEIERILKEREEANIPLPKFLLMENVTNILAPRHSKNFEEWKQSLESMGYYNYVYKLNSENFGVPQKRNRVYMVSVQCDSKKKEFIKNYIDKHSLSDQEYLKKIVFKKVNINDILKFDYDNKIYKIEAEDNNPNDTPSRRKIYDNNIKIFNGEQILCKSIGTITTKQDRHPNSGVIEFPLFKEGKSKYRYLTPRECFLLMGFEEKDFQAILDNNFEYRKNHKFFATNNLHKMAGNSIVVNVLEYIFKQIIYIDKYIL